MWVFLATEVMFFGGIFAAYTIYRHFYLPYFEIGSHLLNVKIGALNTAVLIGSSLTMAMGVRAAQMGKKNVLVACLIMTMILGFVFIGVKLNFEWRQDWIEGLVPGLNFTHDFPRLNLQQVGHVQLFFFFYFAMTGLHALHMIIGEGILAFLVVFSAKGEYGPDRFNMIEGMGLYWHFVDIIWIFLFPLLYLIGGRY